jgi:hypothetical protein
LRKTRIALAVLANDAVVTLDVRRRNLRFDGLSFDDLLIRADALGRAVAALTFGSRPVNLDQHGVINIGTERAFNGIEIRLVAVAR